MLPTFFATIQVNWTMSSVGCLIVGDIPLGIGFKLYGIASDDDDADADDDVDAEDDAEDDADADADDDRPQFLMVGSPRLLWDCSNSNLRQQDRDTLAYGKVTVVYTRAYTQLSGLRIYARLAHGQTQQVTTICNCFP